MDYSESMFDVRDLIMEDCMYSAELDAVDMDRENKETVDEIHVEETCVSNDKGRE